MSEETKKYKKAWKKFQDAIVSFRKRRSEIFANISKKFDQQKIEALRKKLKSDA